MNDSATLEAHDADRDPQRQSAERGDEGRFEMRPDAAIGKQIRQRRADPARHRRIHRVKHAGLPGRLPDRQQQREGGELTHPGVARIEPHHSPSAR